MIRPEGGVSFFYSSSLLLYPSSHRRRKRKGEREEEEKEERGGSDLRASRIIYFCPLTFTLNINTLQVAEGKEKGRGKSVTWNDSFPRSTLTIAGQKEEGG